SGFAASARKLLGAALPGGGSFSSTTPAVAGQAASQGKRPVIISAANGIHWLDGGMEILRKGGDTLDAVLAVDTKVEGDPYDDSVGYGGISNKESENELDASVMHGPTRRAGAVASIRNIKNPSLVA